jgi:uncharacterized protein YbjT (DUF2867 family)
MVIGSGSASFVMLKSLVERLPLMVTPKWIDTRSQPVAIADVLGTLSKLADLDEVPAEVELGGADVLTYRDMMARFAKVRGKRPPAIVKVPVLSPTLSSHWVGPGHAGRGGPRAPVGGRLERGDDRQAPATARPERRPEGLRGGRP